MADSPYSGRPPADRGRLRVAPRVVERIAAHVAAGVPGVGSGDRTPKAAASLVGEHAQLTVDVAIVWPAPAADVAAQVRRQVATVVAGLTPFTTDRVDVRIRAVVAATTPERVQ